MDDKPRNCILTPEENIRLSKAIQAQPCLYDKSDCGYRNDLAVQNAWQEIADQLDFIEDASRAKLAFENLKKRYSKRRSKLRKAQLSNISQETVERIEHDFTKQFQFIEWLGPFIPHRALKSNFKADHDQPLESPKILYATKFAGDSDIDLVFEEECTEDQHLVNLSREIKRNTYSPTEIIHISNGISSNDQYDTSTKKRKSSRPTMVPENIENRPKKPYLMKMFNDNMNDFNKSSNLKDNDVEDRFCASIADDLRHLPMRERLIAKNEIRNIVFKYQMQVLDNESSEPIAFQDT